MLTRENYNELYGEQRVSIKLAAIHETIELLEYGEVSSALSLLRTMAAADDRKQLRQVRNAIYKRYRHALQMGDVNEATALKRLLQQCDEAKQTLTA